MQYFRELVRVMNPHYPERLIKLIAYPVPRLLVGVVSVIKTFMDQKTSQKIEVLAGSDYSALYKYVDYDQLPRNLQMYHKCPESKE